MMVLISSRRSVSIQSSLRGRIGVSLEMMHLLCETMRSTWIRSAEFRRDRSRGSSQAHPNLVHRKLVEHIPRSLNAKEFSRDPDRVERVPTLPTRSSGRSTSTGSPRRDGGRHSHRSVVARAREGRSLLLLRRIGVPPVGIVGHVRGLLRVGGVHLVGLLALMVLLRVMVGRIRAAVSHRGRDGIASGAEGRGSMMASHELRILRVIQVGHVVRVHRGRGEMRPSARQRVLGRDGETADGRREEDVGAGLFLDGLNDVSLARGKDGVQLVVDLTDFGVKTGLESRTAEEADQQGSSNSARVRSNVLRR
jgi:hypothetical protein